MSRKHNTTHNRSKSRYPRRLRDRGETGASVRMKHISRNTTAQTLGMSDAAYAAHCSKIQDLVPKGGHK